LSPGGRIKDSDVETVRERTDIVKLISDYVPLKKSGREFRGPCPFHKEKDPSFYVNPAKGVYYCFGCKASGGVFNFVMQKEGLNFTEAVERLADRIGYQISYERASPEDSRKRTETDRLFKINQTASDFYHYVLTESDAGAGARAYLEERKLFGDIAKEFKVGFAPPGWHNLGGFLAGKGFKAPEMVKAGLARERRGGSGGQGVYDLFRNRVMFPILDHRGRVVAFGGRRMPGGDSADEPKYVNSPETPIYRKGHTLYGYFQSRRNVQDMSEAIVVEGYTDLLGLYRVGVTNVVATLGTALTENHFDLLDRACEKVYLAFDADRAGIEAALRVLEFFTRYRMDIFVLSLPQGEDPATIADKGGAEAFSELKRTAEGLVDFAARKTVDRYDCSTAMGRRRAMEACVPIISRVSSDEFRPVRNDLVRRIGGLLEMPPETVEVFLREASKAGDRRSDAPSAPRPDAMWEKVEREALQVLLHEPLAFIEHQYIDDDYFVGEDNKKILAILKEIRVDDEEVLQAEFDSLIGRMVEGIEDERLRGKVMSIVVESPPECEAGYDGVFDRLRFNFFKSRKLKVQEEIRRTDNKLEPKKYDGLCDQLFEIEQIMKDLFPYDHR
jgi:DNA primase catalytic core